jgi:Ca2+-binding EF-hand superfamily protein
MSKKELFDGYMEYFGTATQKEMEAIFYAADLNKDGYLDIEEWNRAMLIRQGQLSDKKLDQAFH